MKKTITKLISCAQVVGTTVESVLILSYLEWQMWTQRIIQIICVAIKLFGLRKCSRCRYNLPCWHVRGRAASSLQMTILIRLQWHHVICIVALSHWCHCNGGYIGSPPLREDYWHNLGKHEAVIHWFTRNLFNLMVSIVTASNDMIWIVMRSFWWRILTADMSRSPSSGRVFIIKLSVAGVCS